MAAATVFLVPGFFGFTSLGSLNYFYRVEDKLEAALRARGVDARIVECPTQPTGSIRRRALRLLEHVEQIGGDGELHFVGHSTGGLDVRLLTSPGVRLRKDAAEEEIGSRTRSVVTVATPHYGTPLASFFTTTFGSQLLELLTAMATTTGGRYSILAGARLLRAVAKIDDLIGQNRTFLDAMVDRLLVRITGSSDDPLWLFLKDVSRDQGAIIQLTPESMHLFNAAVTDRDGIDYTSVVTVAKAPPATFLVKGLTPSRAALGSAFTLLYLLAMRQRSQYPYPHPGTDALDRFESSIGFDITSRANDGVVPTLSQVYGRVIDAVVADHLDVVGQFRGAGGAEHADWLPSGSNFDEARFESVWTRVADVIADSAG